MAKANHNFYERIDSMDNKERFLSLCSKIERDGMDKLLKWLEEKTDFFEAPASSRFHGSYRGGLLEHSLNVYEETKRLLSAYPEVEVADDSVIICSLFHDLCKTNMYKTEKRNRKNSSGQWESYDAYIINESFCFGGHGSKSVFLLQHFIDLTPEEGVAINCHMGAFDGEGKYVGNAFGQFPFAWLLSAADQAATYIRETERTRGE